MRWKPSTWFKPNGRATVAGATGALAAAAVGGSLAGAAGLSPEHAAIIAAATALSGAGANATTAVTGRILRRPKRKEVELTIEIRNGLTKLLNYLIRSTDGRHLSATASLLGEPDDRVRIWIDQLKEEGLIAEKFADDSLASALAVLVLTIQNARAFPGEPQTDSLEGTDELEAKLRHALAACDLIAPQEAV